MSTARKYRNRCGCGRRRCHTGPVRRLGTGQRVILVIGLGIALLAVGESLSGLLVPRVPTGWTGYAPLLARSFAYPGWPGFLLVLRLVLTAVWVAVSLFIFRQPATTLSATAQVSDT